MIIEVVLMVLPFMIGLAVSGRRVIEIIATLFALEVVLFAFAMRQLEQPAIAAAITTASLSVTSFGLGWLLGGKLPRLQSAGLGGISLVSGAFCTALFAGALRPPVRHEKVELAMWAEGAPQQAWDSVKSFSSLPGERPLSMKLGMPTPLSCELDGEAPGSTRVCHFDEGRVVGSVTAWRPPSQLQVQITATYLPVRFVGLITEGTRLTPRGKETHLLRTVEFDSTLAPAWFWRPIEHKTVDDEQRYSLSGVKGGFVELEAGGVPVRLSVMTNPPTEVTIVPPVGSNRPPRELGRTPIDERAGAFVGDTVLLVNEERGIRFEEPIEYGQPNELKLISKIFKKK